jgi:hypothetical protein
VTIPGDGRPVTLPAAQARQVLDLIQVAGHVISALRARGLERDLSLEDLEQLAALLTNGGDAAQLAGRLVKLLQAPGQDPRKPCSVPRPERLPGHRVGREIHDLALLARPSPGGRVGEVQGVGTTKYVVGDNQPVSRLPVRGGLGRETVNLR